MISEDGGRRGFGVSQDFRFIPLHKQGARGVYGAKGCVWMYVCMYWLESSVYCGIFTIASLVI
jgi:hypothetical protein